MAGALDRYHRGGAAQAAGPARDLGDVEYQVGAIADRRVLAGEVRPVRAQDQRGNPDIQAAVQPGVPAADGVEPAERHREPVQRLPGKIEFPFPGAADVQGLPVHARRSLELPVGECPAQYAQGLGERSPLDLRALQVEPRAVQHQAGDGRDPPARAPAVQPQRDDQAAGRVGGDDHGQAGMGIGDDRQRPLELLVVQGEIRHVMRGLARPPGPAALAQVETVERQAVAGEGIGQLGLEEIVGEAVHVEHSAPRDLAVSRLAPHQHGGDRAFAVRVGAQVEFVAAVARAEDVRLPVDVRHRPSPG
jgi:hypothetical protein